MTQEIPVDPVHAADVVPDRVDPAAPEPVPSWWPVGETPPLVPHPLRWADLSETTLWVAAMLLTGRDLADPELGDHTSAFPPDHDELTQWLELRPDSAALYCLLREAVESKAINSGGRKDIKGCEMPWGVVRIRWEDASRIARDGLPIAPRPVELSVELDGPATLFRASKSELHEAMMQAYEVEQGAGRPAPNLVDLPPLVGVRLALDGKRATQPEIIDMADWFPFPALRNRTGRHLKKIVSWPNPEGLSGLSVPQT